MGDARSINYGRKPLNNAGLEFASARKTSRFAQYTQQKPVAAPQPVAPVITVPVQQQAQPQPVQPYAAPMPQAGYVPPLPIQQVPYGEVPHDKVLYPQLSPITAIEVPVLPEDNLANELAFDVGDSLDENDEFFADMPKSKIVRPGEDLTQETKQSRKKAVKWTFGTVGLMAGIAVLFVSWSLIQRYSPPVSASLRKKVGYPVYQLQPSPAFAVDRKSVDINENDSLVYNVKNTQLNSNFVLSQQKLPEVVKTDESYQQFLSQSQKFASFDTKLGKAYMIKPEGLGEDISVVLKSDNTLLFIRGNGGTPEQTWAQLISSLKLE